MFVTFLQSMLRGSGTRELVTNENDFSVSRLTTRVVLSVCVTQNQVAILIHESFAF